MPPSATLTESVAPSLKTGALSLESVTVMVRAMVSELLPASVAIRLTLYTLLVSASAALS